MKYLVCLFFLFNLKYLAFGFKEVKITELHNALKEDQAKNQHKSMITDLLISNLFGSCKISCPGGGNLKFSKIK